MCIVRGQKCLNMSGTGSSATPVSEVMSEAGEASSASGFVCVCVQKSVEFNVTDHKLHRAIKDKELHDELEKLSLCAPSEYAYQLGGGCRVMGGSGSGAPHPVYIASWGESAAVFEGTLSNLTDLAKAFPSSHTTTTTTTTTTPPAPSQLQPPGSGAAAAVAIPAASAAASDPAPAADSLPSTNPALLLCLMYEVIGSQLLELLRGRFSFCLYHGKTGRVLAARDGSGAVPLYQGLSAAQSLVIGSREEFMTGCEDIKGFEPGYFKYGWYAEPRKFSFSHAKHHHHVHCGIPSRQEGQQRNVSARSGLDQPRRGGNPVRSSLDQARPSAQLRTMQQQGAGAAPSRRSMDSTAAPPGMNSPTSDGWTTVGVRSQRSTASTGSSPPPQSVSQPRRCSMDNSGSQLQATPRAQRPLVAAPSESGKAAAPTRPSDGCSKHLTGGKFQWDVNAPVYQPHAACAQALCESH